jgi:hypothetical protein
MKAYYTYSLIFILLILANPINSQNVIEDNLFTITNERSDLLKEYPKSTILNLDFSILQKLRSEMPSTLNLSIPNKKGEMLHLMMTKVEIFTDQFQLLLSSGKPYTGDLGIYYQGIVNGDKNSFVAISIIDNQISGIISNLLGNYNLGKLKNRQEYILYKDRDIDITTQRGCMTLDNPEAIIQDDRIKIHNRTNTALWMYVEGDYDLINALGNINNAANYLLAIISQGIILFNNDKIDARLNVLKMWDTPSPYKPDFKSDYPASGYLESFKTILTKFNGNVASLITSQNIGGGIASSIGGFCSATPADKMCVYNLAGDIAMVPAYSWDVSTWVHEVGHVLGSRHTHACVWNGNNTQIDDCASLNSYNNGVKISDLEGGSCFNPDKPILPANGGFIMSYCDKTKNVGVNLSQGFGQQSGDVIRKNVSNCLNSYKGGGALFSIDKSTLNFSDEAECQTIELKSDLPWSVASSTDYPPFFLDKISANSGKSDATISICVTKNELPLTRSFPLFFVNTDNTVLTLAINQEAIKKATALFYPTNKSIVKFDGDIVSLDILTNTDWKLIQNTYDTWFTIKSAKSGTTNMPFVLEVSPNSTGLNRYGKIGLVFNNALDTSYFIISQPAKESGYLNVPSQLNPSPLEQNYEIPIFSDLEWEITQISTGWIEPNIKKGKNNGTVIFNVKSNTETSERIATVTFEGKLSTGNIVKTIKLNQTALRSNHDMADYLIFPNPASDIITLRIHARQSTLLSAILYSSDGRPVKSLEDNKSILGVYFQTYDISQLPSGFYTLISKYGENVKRDKIIVLH